MTKTQLQNNFEKFKNEFGHYPSSSEVDKCSYLPSSRYFQRNFGGLVEFRKSINLSIVDMTSGKTRTDTATEINNRARKYEDEVYVDLVSLFGKVRVHREFLFRNDTRNRCDFWIFNEDGRTFMCDMFFAKDRGTFSGCLNHKMKKHFGSSTDIPTYFVSMNDEIDLKTIMENKKIPLQSNQKVLRYNDFIKEIKKIYA